MGTDLEMEDKKAIRRCQYSRKKCYFNADPSSNFCKAHDEEQAKCRYICPSTHVQCIYAASDNSGLCETHNVFLDRTRKRYNVFEQKYCSKLPAYKRENEVDFIEDNLNYYMEHARYVDVLSRPIAFFPVANAGTYSLPEIKSIKNAANDILQTRLKETRNLYQQRAHSMAFALDEELKKRTKNDEKFTIVTHASAETALALQAMIDDHKIKIEELPAADAAALVHPAKRELEQIDVETDTSQLDNLCHYSEIRRNVKASFICNENKEESIEEAVGQTLNFILDYLDTEPEPQAAYVSARFCENQKIQGFDHCFKHLWKEAPALKKCIECDSTCTLASNVCGECLKPYIDLKIENTVCFSDDDEDIPTVSIGATDNDLTAILSECTKKLKESIEEENDVELEITSPHKFDTKNLPEEKRLEFFWGDMLKFGLECENVAFAKEIEVKNVVSPPPSLPLTYNRLYDIDKMISTPSADEPSKPETEAITFCQEGERKPMVLRFPSRTLSEKVATHLDKSPEFALGLEDPSHLPVQFRPVSIHPPQPVTTSLQHQNQLRLPRPTQLSTSTTNTIRAIREVNPGARSNQQYLTGNRHGTPSFLVQNPRLPLPYARPLRLVRPSVRYVYQNVPYAHSHLPVSYSSAGPPGTYPMHPPPEGLTYVYLTRTPIYKRFPPPS